MGKALEEIEEEPVENTSEQKEDKGFRKPKRNVKVSQDEKKKNRLRLVIAQIQAGKLTPN
jgi:hypothetical protein